MRHTCAPEIRGSRPNFPGAASRRCCTPGDGGNWAGVHYVSRAFGAESKFRDWKFRTWWRRYGKLRGANVGRSIPGGALDHAVDGKQLDLMRIGVGDMELLKKSLSCLNVN